MFEFLINKLKAHPRKIVFTEGTDPRILEASARLLSGTFLTPVLVGNPEAVMAAAEEAGFNIRGAEIIDPEDLCGDGQDGGSDGGAAQGQDDRGRVPQAAEAGQLLRHHAGEDGLRRRSAGRRTYSTARHGPSRSADHQDQARQQDRVLLLHPGASLRTGDREVLAMGDCAINIKPTEDELVEIAVETAETAKTFASTRRSPS